MRLVPPLLLLLPLLPLLLQVLFGGDSAVQHAPGAEDGLARHADVGRRGHSGLQARDDGFVLERSLHHLCVGYPRRDVVGGGGQVLLCGEEEKRRRTRRRRDAAVVVFRRVCNV